MLPPRYRLRRSQEVSRVRQQGRRWAHPLVVLFVYRQSHEKSMSTPLPEPATSRFAFAVGRHIGKAARRNQVKRRLRAIVRQYLDYLEPGYDCLVVARPAAATAGYSELEKAVFQLLTRGGMVVDTQANTELKGSPT